jgi:NADH:ubiquinone oxidoreductase subunit 3 (subunit A)
MENEPLLPPGTPSPKAQSWGAFISMVIIVLMIIIGAFYAWGKRIAEENVPAVSTTTAQ